MNPILDVRLTRRFPDVTVIIGLSGTASDPTLVLQRNLIWKHAADRVDSSASGRWLPSAS